VSLCLPSAAAPSALIVQTGTRTVFGQIAGRLSLDPPETEFERGIRHFGGLLTQIMLVPVLFVFAINVFLHKPAVDSLLFAIALTVGLSPELLPAIISVTLARGAQDSSSWHARRYGYQAGRSDNGVYYDGSVYQDTFSATFP